MGGLPHIAVGLAPFYNQHCMQLTERDDFLAVLNARFKPAAAGEGHCVYVGGEAGIGKTSLVREFCRDKNANCKIYYGTCDALFTPRPLAAVYDIAWQINPAVLQANATGMEDRAALFARLFYALSIERETTIIVFEDIHWADEATLDFIKFLARRITQLRCLFILTCRNDEIHSRHPLKHLLGQLQPDAFTRLLLTPFSRAAVEKMAALKGTSGTDVYAITGGNPFYVNEILASYSPGIPDNIKDSILSVFDRQDAATKQAWQLLSLPPGGLEIAYLEEIHPQYTAAIGQTLEAGILMLKNGLLFFKHELYRRTVEASLSPSERTLLNKQLLDLFLAHFDGQNGTERIIHHAKNAQAYQVVVQYAPLAAKQAAAVGAHIEAAKLYFTAIEYCQGAAAALLLQLYEQYAYECYLTNQTKEAIVYTAKALALWQAKNDIENTGNSLRFLSRLWWFEGHRKNAEQFGQQAVELLESQPSTRAKAMAYSNMAQLKMLSYQDEECIFWGEKALAVARTIGDDEVVSHALNNLGRTYMRTNAFMQKGKDLLQQSLEIATKNAYHEHVARAYTNLGSTGIDIKDYVFAEAVLAEGIQYCEERNLDSWTNYMLSCMARLKLENGSWQEAYGIAEALLKNEGQPPINKINLLTVMAIIKMRTAGPGAEPLLKQAQAMAMEAFELQRMLPVACALLEYEWLTGIPVIETSELTSITRLVGLHGNAMEFNELVFWLDKARQQTITDPLSKAGAFGEDGSTLGTGDIWHCEGCPYNHAIVLFEGGEEDKRAAIAMMQKLGAVVVGEKLKQDMRAAGIKKIPRGVRKSTGENIALLTEREVEVLRLLQEGLQNKEIASRLFISAKTVDRHTTSLLFKLDAKTRLQAVGNAIKLNIIHPQVPAKQV